MIVNPITTNDMYISCSGMDEEEARIARKLYYVYGVLPTGNKATDKEKLRQCEMKQFKTEKVVSSKYLTISQNEQEKIIQEWKEQKATTVHNDPEELKKLGATTKGEQVYQAIQMKKHLEKIQEEKKEKAKEEESKSLEHLF